MLKATFARFVDLAAIIGAVVIASLLFTALAVFILPLPAATAALFYAVTQALGSGLENPVQDFVAGLSRYWRTASLVGLPGLALGAVLGVDALFLLQQPGLALAGWVFASLVLVWLAVWLTFWPVLVLRQGRWQELLRFSFWFGMARLPWTALTVAVTALLAAMSALVPWLIPFAPGLAALAASAVVIRNLRRYDLI